METAGAAEGVRLLGGSVGPRRLWRTGVEVPAIRAGAALMAGPAFAVGFALGRRARRPTPAPLVHLQSDQTATAPTDVTRTPR